MVPSGVGLSGDTELVRARAVREIERRELLDRIHEREDDRHRHTLWALVGVSPGALVPLVVSVSQLGASALAGSVFVMTALEAWRAWRAKKDVINLREALAELPHLADTAPSDLDAVNEGGRE